MGAILVALTAGVLTIDSWLAPWYPFLLILVLSLSLMACHEILQLLGSVSRPFASLCYTSVAAVLIANWLPHVRPNLLPALDDDIGTELNPWICVLSVFAVVILAAFLVEMAAFQAPGESVSRISLTVWMVAYLGLLPSFLVQLRWPTSPDTRRGTVALALAIFVPKCGDIGAYFTGRFLGRHRMAPVLSPKKTWEGAAGGLAAAVFAALGLNRLGPVIRGGLWAIIGFGLALGVCGMLGDLAESLIKRDCQKKDASQALPGFGGVLDVVDAILFAAPVAYWWLR
jgi:phosphatidate cytidylyltransferase